MARHDQPGEVSEATRRTEEHEARAAHGAGRPVTEDETAALEDTVVDDDVREHYREMTSRGANDKGEGRVP